MAKKSQVGPGSSPGAVVDRMLEIELEITELGKQEKVLNAEWSALENDLLQRFGEDEISAITGKRASASREVDVFANVKDWDELFRYIARTKSWELIQKRVAVKAFRERVEAGKMPPGTDRFDKVSIKIKALKSAKAQVASKGSSAKGVSVGSEA